MKPKAKRIDIGRFATIELPGEAKGFALDPDSGRLAVVGPWEAQVGFLSAEDLAPGANGAKPQTVSITGKPAAVAFVPRKSGGVFAVGTREPDGLTFLDCQSLRPLKTVSVKLAFPPVLAAAQNAAAPYFYLTLVTPVEGGGAKLGLARIDAERLEMDAQWPEQQFRHISVSPDGQFIYTLPNNSGEDLTRSRPSAPEKGGGAARWDTVISRLGRVPTRYYIDPRGAIIAAGSNVYSADLSQLLMELDYDPLAFLGQKPWMAGIRQDELVIGSTNDGRAVSEVALPEEFLVPDEKLRRPNPRQFTTIHPAAFAQILADEGRGRFVLGTRRHVVTVPLETLELQDEPFLTLREPPTRKAIVDNKYEVSLATLSGAPEAKLAQAPQGMVIENGVLRWTPTDNDVGFLDVRVEFKDGNVTHDEAWPLEVGQPKLDLPFAAEGCVPSADGTRAVVWGIAWSQLGGRERPNSQLALVDLATRKPLAARQLDFPVVRAAVGKHAVYIAAQPVQYSNKPAPLIKLAPDDLRDAGKVDLEVEFLTTVADRYLICSDGRERFGRYTLPDIKPVATFPAPRRFGAAQASVPRQLGDGWLLDGVLWDDGLEQARLLVEPYGFQRDDGVFGESPDRAFRGFVFDSPDAAADARRQDQDVLATAYTPHIPACLTVRKTMPNREGPPVPHSGRIHLDFVDLLSKEVVRSVTLRNGYWQRLPTGGSAQIATTPQHVLVTHYGEVLIVPAAGRDGPIPVPFRIAPRQSTLVLSATRPTKVKYEAEGATKFEFTIQTLASKPPEKLESADGQFEVDLRAVDSGVRPANGIAHPTEFAVRRFRRRIASKVMRS